jgi:hypothetical protein
MSKSPPRAVGKIPVGPGYKLAYWPEAAQARIVVVLTSEDGLQLALLTSSLRRSKWSGIESAADEK